MLMLYVMKEDQKVLFFRCYVVDADNHLSLSQTVQVLVTLDVFCVGMGSSCGKYYSDVVLLSFLLNSEYALS